MNYCNNILFVHCVHMNNHSLSLALSLALSLSLLLMQWSWIVWHGSSLPPCLHGCCFHVCWWYGTGICTELSLLT